MAVAARRSGFTLWTAWVVATAVGQALPAAAALTAQTEFPGDLGAWIWSAVAALPLALLEFAVLRWVLNVARDRAAAWVGVTILAALANSVATVAWYYNVDRLGSLATQFGGDLIFLVGDYLYPVLLGLAQGIVLAMILRRRDATFAWIGANVLALLVTVHVTPTLMGWTGINFQTAPGGYALPELTDWAIYGAVTGGVLVAMTAARATATAPAPAVR